MKRNGSDSYFLHNIAEKSHIIIALQIVETH